MTTTTTVRVLRKCRICGTTQMPGDEKAQYCEVNGCNKLDGEAYKAVNQLLAAREISRYLATEYGCTAQDVARLSRVGRRLVEGALGMNERSDATWALAIVQTGTGGNESIPST